MTTGSMCAMFEKLDRCTVMQHLKVLEDAGLVIAEVELPSTDHSVSLPAWVGREITGEARYANAVLASADAPPRG